MTEYRLDSEHRLTSFKGEDAVRLVELMKDKDIYNNTLRVPFPYTIEKAEQWISLISEHRKKIERDVSFVIRNSQGQLMGALGFDFHIPGKFHSAKLGYWLGKPYWGRGLMAKAVHKICEIGFGELSLIRITAHIFSFNERSGRVLEKSGFQLEGKLRKFYFKEGHYIDSKLYAKIKE